MKKIDGRKYEYIGFDLNTQLYQFKSTITEWDDQEIISVSRAVYTDSEGRRIYYGPNDERMFWDVYDGLVSEN